MDYTPGLMFPVVARELPENNINDQGEKQMNTKTGLLAGLVLPKRYRVLL
ncbi:MAG: hypothetical protein IT486_08880 [Gammaproteobacteria bacterium]|nr:hypothetical protein [Gammaproteobacteria bacterium]